MKKPSDEGVGAIAAITVFVLWLAGSLTAYFLQN